MVVAQDPDWERPFVPDDPARLRARLATLRAQRVAEHRNSDNAGSASRDRARRAQLAAWADDDTSHHGIGFPDRDVQRHGRWRSRASMDPYIDAARTFDPTNPTHWLT